VAVIMVPLARTMLTATMVSRVSPHIRDVNPKPP
jgi:hypothetical protein